MMHFDFMVQGRDKTVTTVVRAFALSDSHAVWPCIVGLAHSIDAPGSQILVANEAGEVVIRVGVASARSLGKPSPEAAEFARQALSDL
jgi:hypothetical protein